MKELIEKFETLYKTTIVPKISPIENYRITELKKSKSLINSILPFRKKAIADNYKVKAKNDLLEIIVSLFAKINKDDADIVDMAEMRDLGFCANANLAEYGSILVGNYKNNKIVFTEADIKRKSNDKEDKNAYAMFNGLTVKLTLNKNLDMKLVLSRRAKDFSTKERENVYLGSKVNFRYNNKDKKLDTLKFEGKKISQLYEILSDDEMKAKMFLTDKLVQKILNTRDAFKSAGITIAVFNSDVYFFIEKDKFFFNNIELEKELTDKDELKKTFVQMYFLFNLINYFCV